MGADPQFEELDLSPDDIYGDEALPDVEPDEELDQLSKEFVS